MERTTPDHYAMLGLDRDCTGEQIRAAYRLLAKQVHPDVNGANSQAVQRMQELNAAYEMLVDEERRSAYDAHLRAEEQSRRSKQRGRPVIVQDVHLRIAEFLNGTILEVRVNEPVNQNVPEIYSLELPPETAPGTKFRVARHDGGAVVIRTRALPDHRFKVRGSDLKCDLRITFQRAAQGGTEWVLGPTGTRLRVNIPRNVARGETLRFTGEGLPTPRGGRGDLLVRVLYQPQVQVRRAPRS